MFEKQSHKLSFFGLLFLSVLIIYFILQKSFVGDKFTCNNYILNSYLYINLALIIVALVVILMDQNPLLSIDGFRGWRFIMLIIGMFGLLIATMITNPNRVVVKHMLWLGFILLMGIMMYPIYYRTKQANTFLIVLMTTLVLVFGLTMLAFYKPEMILLSWGTGLFVALIVGVIFNIMLLFFGRGASANKMMVMLSYGFILLFSLYILHDTKKLQVNAKICVKPDYINESMGIFLDVINLFSRIGHVTSK